VATNCAAYFIELDQLADDEPQVGPWLAKSSDPSAKACGLDKPGGLSALLTYLAKR
jgi:hypothetical protein